MEEGFNLLFSAHLLELSLEPEKVVKPLLREVRKLWEMDSPPEGIDGCDDCLLLQGLVSIIK